MRLVFPIIQICLALIVGASPNSVGGSAGGGLGRGGSRPKITSPKSTGGYYLGGSSTAYKSGEGNPIGIIRSADLVPWGYTQTESDPGDVIFYQYDLGTIQVDSESTLPLLCLCEENEYCSCEHNDQEAYHKDLIDTIDKNEGVAVFRVIDTEFVVMDGTLQSGAIREYRAAGSGMICAVIGILILIAHM